MSNPAFTGPPRTGSAPLSKPPNSRGPPGGGFPPHMQRAPPHGGPGGFVGYGGAPGFGGGPSYQQQHYDPAHGGPQGYGGNPTPSYQVPKRPLPTGASGAPPAPADPEPTPKESATPSNNATPAAGSPTTSGAAALPTGEESGEDPDAVELSEEEEFPEDFVYTFAVFKKLRKCTSEMSEAVKEWSTASALWDKVPGGKPDHMWSREGMFSDEGRKPASKIIKERTLAHQVRGILTRLAPEKYDDLLEELLALPIRQSTQEEIRDVVSTMYSKAVNPAEAIYVEWYIKMIVALVEHANLPSQDGTTLEVGKQIRKAILDRCQQEFEKPFILLPEEVNEDGDPLPQSEKDSNIGQNMESKARLKANVVFLGCLYVNKLVLEKVVQIVLYQLIYGKERHTPNGNNKRHPEKYELEMFNALLRKVGPYLTKETNDKFIVTFMKSVDQLSRNHKEKRIQFMMEDLHTYWKNGWSDPRKKNKPELGGPMKIKDFETHQLNEQRRKNEELEKAANQPKHITRPTVIQPKKPEINVDDLTKQFASRIADYDNTHELEPAIEVVKKAKEHRATVMTPWLKRILTMVKFSEKREKMGELLRTFQKKEAMNQNDINNLLRNVVTEIVNDAEYDDNPKLFTSWAQMIRAGEPTFSQEAHTMFLKILINSDPRVPLDTIVTFIKNVSDYYGTSILDVKPNDGRRFRLLPAVLSYTPPFITAEEDLEFLDEEDEEDLLDKLADSDLVDSEIQFFMSLYDGCSSKELVHAYKKNDQKCTTGLVMKVVCAVFTFIRCDPEMKTEADKCGELLRVITTSNTEKKETEQAILTEAFATWKELDRMPKDSLFSFIKWMCAQKIVTKDGLEAFKVALSRAGEAGREVAKQLDAIKF